MSEHIDKAKGRLKQAAGELTDDDELKRDGEIDEASGKVKGAVESARDAANDAIDAIKDKVKRD